MHLHDRLILPRDSRDAFRAELIARGTPASTLRLIDAHERHLMYTYDQIIAAQTSVIGDLQAEVATLQGQMGTDADTTAEAALAIPAVVAKLAALSNTSTGSTANTSTGSPTTSSGVVTSPPAITLAATGTILTDGAGRAVYTYSGTGTPDPTVWPVAGTYTPAGGPAETVYYYAGDAAAPAGTATGVLTGVWATIPAPAATA